LNCFAPAISSGAADQLQYLEAFWESDAPRIGDADAIGFDKWVEVRLAS
jgi:hypothetical protein